MKELEDKIKRLKRFISNKEGIPYTYKQFIGDQLMDIEILINELCQKD